MAIRTDLSINWLLSPRIITVSASGGDPTELVLQDLVDTVTNEEDDLRNMTYTHIISAAGKEVLGGGVVVGITCTLLDTQVKFEPRTTEISAGTITTPDTNGILLIDGTADFVSDGVKRGDIVINETDDSVATVAIVATTQLTCDPLASGSDNQFDTADAYSVFELEVCNITGGNLVAVDDVGDPMSPIFPSFGTQIVLATSSSATIQEITAIQYASFQGVVTIDAINGVNGIDYPIGTAESPVNNLTDAQTIAVSRGFKKISVIDDLTIGATDDVNNYHLMGECPIHSTFTFTSGCTTEGTKISDATLQGTTTGKTNINDCTLLDIVDLDGDIFSSMLKGDITLGGSNDVQFINCFDGLPGLGLPSIDAGTGRNIGLWNWTGGLELKNKTGSEPVSVNMVSGRLVIASTVVDGNILVKGVGICTDNSTGSTTVDTTGLINPGLVWEEILANHITAGTYGAELATKADIGASAATDYTQASSGTVVYGTETSGDYTSTQVHDNTYWQITEHADDGITVEIVFNLPDSNHRAGIFRTHGRYTGQPSLTHYQEVWAYNYDSIAWELLVESFMPGGNTTDMDYSHEYYERHIDRSDNDKVTIRIIHNVTTYNATHNLYIDYAEVSSLDVITAGDIAIAVWEETQSDHLASDTTGESLDQASNNEKVSVI